MNKHQSSLDRTSMLITIGTAILGIFVIYQASSGHSYSSASAADKGYLIFTTVLFAALLLGTYLFRTNYIVTDGNAISIHRPINVITIPYAEINSIMPLTKTDMGMVFRTFGNGGLFGYTGMFYNKAYGSMRWYCTNRAHYMLIEKKNGKKMVISPDKPNELIQNIKQVNPTLKFTYPEEAY